MQSLQQVSQSRLQLPRTFTFDPALFKDRAGLEYVCSSSSADSIAGDSNHEGVGYREKRSKLRESVLNPRKQVRVKAI